MIFVFDSTTLIYLGRVGLLKEIKNLEEDKIIPKSVYDEVVKKGVERGATDAYLIEVLVKDHCFRIVTAKDKKVMKRFRQIPKLHKADAETLTVAKEVDGIAIMDESKGRGVANIYGIEVRGSIYILFRLLSIGVLSKEEMKDKLDAMINIGWRCSTELYTTVLRELEKAGKD